MINLNRVNGAIAALLMAVSLGVSAIECNQASPNLEKEGHAYFDVTETKPLTPQQKSQVSALLSPFVSKRLKGTGTSIECVGPERTAKQMITKETITAKIEQQSDGRVSVYIESYDVKRKASHKETLSYFGHFNPYRIISATDNDLVIVSKLRIKKALNEELVELGVQNNTLTINITRYRNGYFAIQRTIHLE